MFLFSPPQDKMWTDRNLVENNYSLASFSIIVNVSALRKLLGIPKASSKTRQEQDNIKII